MSSDFFQTAGMGQTAAVLDEAKRKVFDHVEVELMSLSHKHDQNPTKLR